MPVIDDRAVASRIWAYIEIEGSDATRNNYEITTLDLSFPMNSIPTAQFVVGVGKIVNTEIAELLEQSDVVKAEEFFHDLLYMKPVKAHMQVSGSYDPLGTEWPEDDFIIFDGYITGISASRQTGGLSVVLNCTHWLIDLNSSSALSSKFTANSGANILMPPIIDHYNLDSEAVDGDNKEHNIASAVEWELYATDELWSKSIKPRLRQLASEARIGSANTDYEFNIACYDPEGSPATHLDNTLASPRITEDSVVSHFDDDSKADIPSMKMDSAFTDGDTILAEGVEKAIVATLSDSRLAGTTMLSAIMYLADMFHFTIVPLVETAVIAPTIGCLTDAYHRTIRVDEYDDFRPNYAITRLLRGMLMDGTGHNRFGVFEEVPHAYGFGGCYLVDNDLPDSMKRHADQGAIEFVKPPKWLNTRGLLESKESINTVPIGTPSTDVQSSDEEGSVLVGFIGHSMMTIPEESEDEETPEDSTVKIDKQDLGNLYCKSAYWKRQFLYRVAELSGKLRFDIAPGSIVRIESLDGKISRDSLEPTYLYGQVAAVQITVNCQQGTARTSFSLTSMRTEAEKDFGVEKHPLYDEAWVGTVLQKVNNVAELDSSEKQPTTQ